MKGVGGLVSEMLKDIPDGLRIVTEFLWKARWFLTIGFVGVGVYTVVMKVLPYLMVSFIIKMVLGSFLPFLSL